MNISKSDFKIIFNKMISYDNQIINKYIENLNLSGKTGDEHIDKIVKNYDSSYILRVMNKINNKVLHGGDNQTSQEEPHKEQVLDVVSETPVNKEEIKVINIVDNNSDVFNQIPVEKVESKHVEQVSVTSSEMPSELPDEQLSATSEVPVVRKSETFMNVDSVTSSELPAVIPSEQPSATSSDVHHANTTDTTTSKEIPEPVTKSELSKIFIQEKKPEPTVKMSVNELIEKLKVKSKLLKEKESELKSKETELDNRQKIIVQAEDDSRRILDEVNKQVDDLKKEKEQITAEVEGLKNESVKLKDNISEIEVEVANNDLALTETESAQSLLEKIFG